MRAARWLKWIAVAVLILISCLGLVVGTILGTETGRLWLVERAISFAAQAGVTLEIQDLQTPNLSTWRGAQLRV